MGRVALLSEELINQIAAGEVVERPASVVKELVENAVDAGARTVRVALAEGGLASISVGDDGVGMSREDATLALCRHATSKLRDLDGLSRIQTMGFRGEALPAIASVSRFRLHTSERGAQVGTQLFVEGGGEPRIEDAAAPGGTVVVVEDLFFNTPARRKFMKRAQTELGHAQEWLHRIALANPTVGFFLEVDGRPLLSSPGSADLRNRIGATLGGDVYPHLLPVDERHLHVQIDGFICSPELTFATQKGLYTFVNGRFIKDRGLNHALQRGFQEALPPGRQPVAVLFLTLDPRDVDVNVHPQKLEVRFADPRSIAEAAFSAVQRALRQSPWMTANQPAAAPSLQGAHYQLAVERFLQRAAEPSHPEARDEPRFPSQGAPSFGQLLPTINDAPPKGHFSSLKVLGALSGRYLVCEGQGGTLTVVDPHAARERLFLERLRGPARREGSLFSATVPLSPKIRAALDRKQELLSSCGVEFDSFGGDAVAVRSLPAELTSAQLPRLFSDIADAIPDDAEVLRVLACHAASSRGGLPSEAEARALFRGLEDCSFEAAARHPAIILSETPLLELERRSAVAPKI